MLICPRRSWSRGNTCIQVASAKVGKGWSGSEGRTIHISSPNWKTTGIDITILTCQYSTWVFLTRHDMITKRKIDWLIDAHRLIDTSTSHIHAHNIEQWQLEKKRKKREKKKSWVEMWWEKRKKYPFSLRARSKKKNDRKVKVTWSLTVKRVIE